MNAQNIAAKIREAYSTKIPIKPIRDKIGLEKIALAYEIQDINTHYLVENGARIVGKKIGLTSPAVQKQLGVDQPDFGVLFDHMEVLNGLSISTGQLMQPKAESEIAFILGEDLDVDNMTIIDIINAIDYALPAIEIVGSRIENWDIKITDTVADNASASHYVLGHTPKTLDEFDLVNCKMQMQKNGAVVSEGMGYNCLGSPLNAVLWLAKKMLDFENPLLAGEVVLSGALGPMVPVEKGDHISTLIEGLGHVSLSFD